jgi:hypothetical protein
VDVCEILGILPPELKQVVNKLISVDSEGRSEPLPVVHYLESLVKITTLLGKNNQTEQAVLSILAAEDTHR